MLERLEPLATTPGAYVFAVILGLLFGSFANVCIYRWPPTEAFPEGRSIVKPGSHCFACQAPIAWYDNVPLLAWLWLRGKCRHCKAPFSPRYLIVEAVTGLLFGFAWWITVVAPLLWEPFGARLLHFAVAAAFVFVMVVITFIDLDTQLILDKITLPAIPLFYGASLLLGDRPWYDGLIGIAVGYGVVELLFRIWMAVRKIDAIGGGDGKLLALVGALLGWKAVLFALGAGSMIGVAIILPVLLVKHLRAEPEPDTEPAPEPERHPYAWRWVLIGGAVALGANIFGAVAIQALALPTGELLLVALILGSVIGGAVVGRYSPGHTVAEAGLAGALAIAALAAIPETGAFPRLEIVHDMWREHHANQILVGLSVPLIAALIGAFLGERFRDEPAGDDVDAGEEDASLMHTALPFGPFLAAGATLYLFAEPWFQLNFHLPGG